MKPAALWQISVTASREAEDAIAALLERVFGRPASVYTAEGQDVSVVTVYSSKQPKEVLSKREALEAGLRFLTACELELGASRILIRKVPRGDWTTSWKKYFKTIELGSVLLIKPSWSKQRRRPGQAVVTLDPGLSFGTGQHPTTSFCLQQLVRVRKTGQPQSFLDIGTGSGILAIAAVKLGYQPVNAFDNDPIAVRVCKANARKNRIAHKLEIVRQDLSKLPERSRFQYDLICANLVDELLIAQARRIVNRLSPGGRLVLSGLLTSQFATVRRRYARVGLSLEVVRVEGEWKSAAFIAPG